MTLKPLLLFPAAADAAVAAAALTAAAADIAADADYVAAVAPAEFPDVIVTGSSNLEKRS